MSPSLGVPPLECLFYSSTPSSKVAEGGISTSFAPRRRHFSLEDYHDGLFEESSSSSASNDSAFQQLQQPQQQQDSTTMMMDLKPIKSFMNGEPFWTFVVID